MAICTKCGRKIADTEPVCRDGNDIVCENCDRDLRSRADRVISAGRIPRPSASASGNTMGTIGFILSLVSILFFAGIASPIALIFSLRGLKKEPRGLAIAGTVLSSLGTAIFIVLAAFCLIMLFTFEAAAHRGEVPVKHRQLPLTQPAPRKRNFVSPGVLELPNRGDGVRSRLAQSSHLVAWSGGSATKVRFVKRRHYRPEATRLGS